MSAASGVVELADDEEYADLDLSEVRPGDEPWRRRRFVRCRFAEADLRGLVTEGCSFDECDFTSADLGESAHRARPSVPAPCTGPPLVGPRSAAARYSAAV